MWQTISDSNKTIKQPARLDIQNDYKTFNIFLTDVYAK